MREVRILLGLPADKEKVPDKEKHKKETLKRKNKKDAMADEKEKKEELKRKNKWDAIEGNISIDYLYDVMETAQEAKDVDLEVKCFFFITFNTLLMPSTNNYLDLAQMQAGMDLERIPKINWRKVVLNQMVQGVKAWNKPKKPLRKSDNITGPVIVLLVSIFKAIIFHDW